MWNFSRWNKFCFGYIQKFTKTKTKVARNFEDFRKKFEKFLETFVNTSNKLWEIDWTLRKRNSFNSMKILSFKIILRFIFRIFYKTSEKSFTVSWKSVQSIWNFHGNQNLSMQTTKNLHSFWSLWKSLRDQFWSGKS